MAQALYPPYRAIGYSYTLSLFVFRFCTLSRYTPPPPTDPYRIDIACIQNKIRGGVSHVKLPSEGYRAIGGYRSYSIAISRYTAPLIGSVPMTPDPNTSAEVSRYKWEAYRDTNWWCIYYFLPQGGHTFTKVCHRNGSCIAILFRMYWGQGSI